MKNLYLTIVLIVVTTLAGSCGRSQNSNAHNSLRVLAWNVWHAGHSEAYGQKACDGVIGMLKTSRADVILMVETYGASDKVADSLGYYHRLLSSNLSIYSRFPIVETYTFPDSISTFNFGGVMINRNGQRIRIFDTWLHYLPDATKVPTHLTEREIREWDDAGSRDDEAAKILTVLKPFMAQADSIPIIIGGDFNIHSHLDWTEQTKNLYHHGGAVVAWTVSRMMQQAGFRDSFRELHPQPDLHPGTTWNGGGNRQDRIDYLYYMGRKLRAVNSETHNAILGEEYDFHGTKFLYASDHGLVMTDFEVL